MTDMETFILDTKGTIFTIYKYKKVYTPYEQDKKYSDESIYEDPYGIKVHLLNAIEVYGDTLLEVDLLQENTEGMYERVGVIEYCLLSEITLCIYDEDNEVIRWLK